MRRKVLPLKYASCGNPSCHYDHLINPSDCLVRKLAEAHEEQASLQKKLQSFLSKNMSTADNKVQEIRHQWKTELLEEDLEKAASKINSAKALIRTYLKDPRASFEAKERIANILFVLDGQKLEEETNFQRSPKVASGCVFKETYDNLKLPMFDGPNKSSPEPQDGKKNHPIQLPSLVFEKIQSNDNCIKNDHLKLKESVAGGAFNQHKSVRSSIHYHETSIKTELNSVYHLEVNSCVPPVVYSQSQKSNDAQKFNFIAPHVWYKINDVREPEMCKYCQKITELNKTAFKCQDCKASCHFECMEKVEHPCVIPEHLYA